MRSNTAELTAGGAYLLGGRFTMKDRSSINGNDSGRVGGIFSDAVRRNPAAVTMKRSSVIKRNVGEVGGIHLEEGTLTMLDESSIRGHRTLPSSAASPSPRRTASPPRSR